MGLRSKGNPLPGCRAVRLRMVMEPQQKAMVKGHSLQSGAKRTLQSAQVLFALLSALTRRAPCGPRACRSSHPGFAEPLSGAFRGFGGPFFEESFLPLCSEAPT